MLLTVDIGTSNFKSAIWDFAGNRAAFAASPLSIGGECHEADSGQWLKAFEDCCRNLGAQTPLSAVSAVVISGNGPSLVPVLGNGKWGKSPPSLQPSGLPLPPSAGDTPATPPSSSPLSVAPARLWLDRRAVKAAEQVSALMGGYVDASFYLPKALDIKLNEPQLYEKTKHFLGCPELLAFALTGEARTVFPSDGFDRWFWTDSILERLNLDKEKFPPFIRPGEIFGGLTPHTAIQYGLKPDIPVISGGPDFFAAILGSGTIKPGQACDRAGTSEGINACTDHCIDDKRLMSYRHPVPPFWNLSGIVSTTGKAIEWACALLDLNHHDFYALAETAHPGADSLIFLPYLAGERAPVWNPSARGILRNLTLSSGRPEFARAVLEGICFAIRDIIAVMEESGAAVSDLRIAGTAGGSNVLNQIKADITQKPVLVPRQKEAELLGLAIIGSRTLGKFASFSDAANALVHIENTFHPNGKNTPLYDNLFQQYRETRLATATVSGV